MSDDFLKNLFFRFAGAALMPNFLVFCFWANDMADNRYPMWRLIVGPYWHGELILFFSVIASVAIWIAIRILPSVLRVASELREEIANGAEERRCKEMQDRLCEEAERQIKEEEARFKGLPMEERNRIIEERERCFERRWQEKRLAAEKEEQKKLAEQAARNAEEERRRIGESKPENVRKNAVGSFIGRQR